MKIIFILILFFNFLISSEYNLRFFLKTPSTITTKGSLNFKGKNIDFTSVLNYSGFINYKKHMGILYNLSVLKEDKYIGSNVLTTNKTFLIDNNYKITYILIERLYNNKLMEKKKCKLSYFSPIIPENIINPFNSEKILFNCIDKRNKIYLEYIFNMSGYFTIKTIEYKNEKLHSLTEERFKISKEGFLLDYFNLN